MVTIDIIARGRVFTMKVAVMKLQ